MRGHRGRMGGHDMAELFARRGRFTGGPEDDEGRGRPRGGRRGRFGGWQQADLPDASDASGRLAGRLPEGWFTGAPQVEIDRDEILIIGTLPDVEPAEGASAADRAAQESGRIQRFREETRDERIRIAREAEHRYGRQISWGAICGETHELFTTFSAPVMTRLRQNERRVLDTLVDSGVARSRSDALAWCVRLVGRHTDTWLNDLRSALSEVERLRAEGPESQTNQQS